MSSIVVGYAATDEGRAALEVAIKEADLRSVQVVVVSSHLEGVHHPEFGDAAETQLEQARLRLVETGLAFSLRPQIRGMDPAEDIIAVAEETDAELIVIGVRRRSPVGKLILGSHAQRILLEATRPVLAVKAD